MTRTYLLYFLSVLGVVFLNACNTSPLSDFPMDKPYWSSSDYDQVYRNIKYNDAFKDEYPTFSNPETSVLVEKIFTNENFLVVTSDEALGLNHKAKEAEEYFQVAQHLQKLYSETNRQDELRYEKEFIAASQFLLATQIPYFKLGNDRIIQNADNPDARSIKSVLSSNERTIIDNFQLYLDIPKRINLSEEGETMYAEGIDKYFHQLVNTFPDADFRDLQRKIVLIKEKVSSDVILTSLSSLESKISDTQSN